MKSPRRFSTWLSDAGTGGARRLRGGEERARGALMSLTSIGEIIRGDREVFPPYLYEAYRSTRRRAPSLPLIEVPLTISELTGQAPPSAPSPRKTPTSPGTRAPGKRWANGSSSQGVSRITLGIPSPHAVGGLAGERVGTLPAQAGRVARTPGSKLPGDGTLPDGRRRSVSILDDSAGGIPVEEPHERLASVSCSLFAVRAIDALTAGHADVLPR